MRNSIAMLLACMSIGLAGMGGAWAGSAYDDVPRDHWAFNALDYLTDQGVLEGYPDGFFKGDRTLTRYEFAQAIARLLDTIDAGMGGDEMGIMIETLRAEFSDQLAAMIGEMETTINTFDGRIGVLEDDSGDNAGKISSLESIVSGLKPGPNWKGSFRYRWEWRERSSSSAFTAADFPASGGYERFRQRIQFMLGYNKQINDKVMVGFRFKTNTGLDATSGNFTLGSNQGRTAEIFLDRAYVKYTPSWFGWYSTYDCSCGNTGVCGFCNPRLDIYAGMYPNITYDPHEMIMDADVNLQGLAAVYHFNQDFQILAATSVAVEYNGSDYFDDDAVFCAIELKHTNFLWDCFDAWIGCYSWDNENLLWQGAFAGNRLYGFDFNNDGVVNDSDRFSPNFSTIKGGLQHTFHCTFDKPLAVYGEYMINTQSDAEARINLVNPFISAANAADGIIYDATDDTGWLVGGQYGAKPKSSGDWYAFARYKEVGANAIVHGFADADSGGANTNSLEVHWAKMWAPNSLVGITYFLNVMHNAFGFFIPAWKEDESIVQVDWTFRF
ncbi:putative porin [bacterium]|nr:putative porin [bacterium]